MLCFYQKKNVRKKSLVERANSVISVFEKNLFDSAKAGLLKMLFEASTM